MATDTNQRMAQYGDRVNRLLAEGKYQEAVQEAWAFRAFLLKLGPNASPEVDERLSQVDDAICQLAEKGYKIAGAPHASQNVSLDSVENTLAMVGSVLGILSFLGGIIWLVMAFTAIDERQTIARALIAGAGIDAILIGLYASCLARVVATMSARIRQL